MPLAQRLTMPAAKASLFLFDLVGCSPSGKALGHLGIDVKQTPASGLSVRAYMAGQLQVAHSSELIVRLSSLGDHMAARKLDLRAFCLPRLGT
jgi:hypothetical protein